MPLNDFHSLMRVYIDIFVSNWWEKNKSDPLVYPLEYDNANEWFEQFFVFVEYKREELEEDERQIDG